MYGSDLGIMKKFSGIPIQSWKSKPIKYVMSREWGESSYFEKKRIKTKVKVPKCKLSANNKVIILRQLGGRLRSSHPIISV